MQPPLRCAGRAVHRASCASGLRRSARSVPLAALRSARGPGARAAFLDERCEVLRERRIVVLREAVEEGAQHGHARLHQTRPVDQRQSFERGEFIGDAGFLDRGARSRCAQHGGRIDMRNVHKKPRRRRVRAALVRLGGEHGVHRADGERVAALLGRLRRKRCERGEVAHAAVAVAAQAIHLRGDAPERRRAFSVVGVVMQRAPCVIDRIAARRRDGERRAMVVDDERVIARLGNRREQRGFAFGDVKRPSMISPFSSSTR